MERHFCKVPSASCIAGGGASPPSRGPGRRGGSGGCVKKLFVTGTAGSGTHFVAHFLSKIAARGVKVKHESPTTSPDVLVSWPSRCPARGRRLDFKKLGFPINGGKDLKQPMVDWAHKQLGARCAYEKVVHLVRHPLRFLSSNFAFGQCLECWALVEHSTLPPITAHTADARAAIVENRRRLYQQTGGREWDASMRRTLLKAFMLYWVTWNRMIAHVADERIRVEDADLRNLCVKYKLGSAQDCDRKVKEESIKKASHGGGQDKVTWAEIEAIDSQLAAQIWELAQSYGYGRDPPPK